MATHEQIIKIMSQTADQPAEQHEILIEFLKSNWTNDGELWKRAYDAYSGSMGRWIDAVGDRNVVHSDYDFRDSKIKEMKVVAAASFKASSIILNKTVSKYQFLILLQTG